MYVLPIKDDTIEDSSSIVYTCVGLYGWDKSKRDILLECTRDDSTVEYVKFNEIKKINKKLVSYDKSSNIFTSPTIIRSTYSLPQPGQTIVSKITDDLIVENISLSDKLKVIIVSEDGRKLGMADVISIHDESGSNLYKNIDDFKSKFKDYI